MQRAHAPLMGVFAVALVGVVNHSLLTVEPAAQLQRRVVNGRLEVGVLRVDDEPYIQLRRQNKHISILAQKKAVLLHTAWRLRAFDCRFGILRT